jgi:hypothetical protein
MPGSVRMLSSAAKGLILAYSTVHDMRKVATIKSILRQQDVVVHSVYYDVDDDENFR